MGALSLPSERFARFGNPARPGLKTANFAAFGSWPGALPKNAESLRHSDAELTDDQIAVLKALSDTEPMQVDDLTELVDIPTRRVLSALTVLEIDQYVVQHAGKHYTRAVTLTE